VRCCGVLCCVGHQAAEADMHWQHRPAGTASPWRGHCALPGEAGATTGFFLVASLDLACGHRQLAPCSVTRECAEAVLLVLSVSAAAMHMPAWAVHASISSYREQLQEACYCTVKVLHGWVLLVLAAMHRPAHLQPGAGPMCTSAATGSSCRKQVVLQDRSGIRCMHKMSAGVLT
jgi:hypothetical protein